MRVIYGLVALVIVTTLAMGAGRVRAAESIYRATLAEQDQKTGEVSVEQLKRILVEKAAVVLDTRSRAQYDAGHIPGADVLDGPLATMKPTVERLVNGDKSKALVLYCNGPHCQASKRAADQLVTSGFTDVRRFQLGIPIWRALGEPTEIELDGIKRIFGVDRTAVYLDARSPDEFRRGTIPGAQSASVEDLISGTLKKVPLPEDDFNRRVVLFGRDAAQARKLAEVLSGMPWHNVSYFPGSFEVVAAAVSGK